MLSNTKDISLCPYTFLSSFSFSLTFPCNATLDACSYNKQVAMWVVDKTIEKVAVYTLITAFFRTACWAFKLYIYVRSVNNRTNHACIQAYREYCWNNFKYLCDNSSAEAGIAPVYSTVGISRTNFAIFPVIYLHLRQRVLKTCLHSYVLICWIQELCVNDEKGKGKDSLMTQLKAEMHHSLVIRLFNKVNEPRFGYRSRNRQQFTLYNRELQVVFSLSLRSLLPAIIIKYNVKEKRLL